MFRPAAARKDHSATTLPPSHHDLCHLQSEFELNLVPFALIVTTSSASHTHHHLRVMAFNTQPSTSRKDTKSETSSMLPPQHHFSFEEKCFLMHHANYCVDFDNLCEKYKMQFNSDRSPDAIERFLIRCGDEEFFILTEAADKYKKWYTAHPLNPVCPIILLACRAMPIEHRAYLAYHHYHGMDSVNLTESLNLMFPTETRGLKQIINQLNLFQQKRQLLTSLTIFSIRYPWNPEYKPVAGAPATKLPELLSSATSAASENVAGRKLDQDRKQGNDYNSNHAAMATQLGHLK